MTIRRPRKGDHVIIDHSQDTPAIRCTHCGDVLRYVLPMSVQVLLALWKAYGREHRNCQLGATGMPPAIIGQSLILVTEGPAGHIQARSFDSAPGTSTTSAEWADGVIRLMGALWEDRDKITALAGESAAPDA